MKSINSAAGLRKVVISRRAGKSIWLNCAPTLWTTVGNFLVCSGQPFCIEYSVNQRHKENHVRRTEGKVIILFISYI